MGGTAIGALSTVPLVTAVGTRAPFLLTAAVLAGHALLAWIVLRDAPGRDIPQEPLGRRLAAVLRLPLTWQAAALYAVLFGGYVAFSVYLPSYLKAAYELAQPDAANRMAGFVLLAVLMRPVGGWLSDRIGPFRVLAGSLVLVSGTAAIQVFTPGLMPLGTMAFLTMAAGLGAGSGATFALVAKLAPQERVGAITGVVGGLGGFLPPLVMGAVFDPLGPTPSLGPARRALPEP